MLLSCDVEDGKDLNGPSTESISSGLSRGELRETIGGILSDMRIQLGTQIDAQSVAGREYWRVSSSDPRWVADLLTGTLDNNTFYTTNPYAARYATIKNINLALEGLANTTEAFSAEEIAGIRGFANTIKAHELLMVLNQQYQNGIRVDVSNPDKLGPFLNYQDSLSAIFSLLTDAAADLSNAGSEFAFVLPSGFSITSDPASFLGFTNGLAARVEVYRGNYSSAKTLLENSFMDNNVGADLQKGVYFSFSLTGADIANPLFFGLNATVANVRLAHPSFVADAEAGDTRLGKVVFRETKNNDTGVLEPNPLVIKDENIGDLVGEHDVFIYKSNIDPVPVMKNEELILLYAEANHISDPVAAVAAIDVVRTAAGLPAYTGSTTPTDLVNEILKQKRYSLFAEGGHRWIDLRRFNKLGELPIDRTGDGTFEQFPTPANENK
ncbi:hypothetical protein GCM10007384_27330 [Aquimarina muelleri]|uniref:RagB/SusD domain-containing protein n=2 Tax=Aquimarina muelleri TaxID=279356 RepID=A0A918JXR7_9FLAO|nr:hypothetical protein GCM10007384_27330 [Aquimarina muelleri]